MTMTAPPHRLNIHQGTKLHERIIVDSPFRNYGGTYLNLTAGAFSYIANDCFLYHVDIGRYSSIGDNVHILSQHPTESLSTSPAFYQALFDAPYIAKQTIAYDRLIQTTIGNDVWIGSGVKIKTGVTIGDGAVIGAGSVVTKDVLPFSIVGGTPAKLIKMRFVPEIIKRIQSLEWWQYNLLDYELDWSDLEKTLTTLETLKNSGELVPYIAPRYQLWNENGKIVGKPI